MESVQRVILSSNRNRPGNHSCMMRLPEPEIENILYSVKEYSLLLLIPEFLPMFFHRKPYSIGNLCTIFLGN